MKLKIRWSVFNAVFVALLCAGLFQGIIWAKNLALFIVWLRAFALIAVYFHEETKQKVRASGCPVPASFRLCYGVAIVAALAAGGATVSAVVSLISLVCGSAIFDAVKTA